MSLHKFAEQVAAHGRGDDSLLVHMTPDEVRNLQKFAEANGTTLTINPTTGLPEAGLLSDLFKAVAPIALGAFLGPAGLGMSAAMAGVATGGITALATGSLSRGLMAGMGAYGGAGLGGALSGAGESALASQGANLGTALTDTQAQSLGFQNAGTAAQTNAMATAPIDKLSAGFTAATASPTAAMDFAKANYKPLLAAAAPIMAGAMVPTITKFPEAKSTGNIRQMAFNINPDTGRPDPLYGIREMAPVKASEWGDKTFQGQRDLFYNQNQAQNPYQLGVASLNQPPQQPLARMADGGIVALADGGIPGYAEGDLVGGNLDTSNPIYQYFAKPETQALLASGNDKAIADALVANKWALSDVAKATGTQDKLADYTTRFLKAENTPTTDSSEFMTAAGAVGLQNQALANAMQNAGMSQAAQYATTHGLSDVGGITGPASDLYNQFGYKAGALPGDQGGLEGYYSNINYSAKGLQSLIDAGKLTGQQAREAALTEMNRIGMSAADLKAATGKTLAELFPDTTKKPVTVINPYTGVASGAGPITTTVLPTTPMTNAPAGTSNPYGNVNNPGDLTFNPDGTITVQPNLPGRPYGGYSGITELTNAYTAGGGSTGYVSPVVKTAAEHDKLYNKQTGDSLEAYNYLIGKGGAKYPTKSGVSEIMKPYEEAVLGYPTDLTKKKYINVNGKMVLNPDYKAPQTQAQKTAAATAAAKAGKADTIYVTNNRGETEAATLGDDGNYRTSGGETYDVTGKQVVAQGGMMGYSVGGGLGSLGSYSDGGRLLKGPGDGVSDSIPATIGRKQQPARLADGEFVVPARIVSELGNGSTDAGAKKLYAMMDRVQRARGKTTGKNKVAANSRADKYLPA